MLILGELPAYESAFYLLMLSVFTVDNIRKDGIANDNEVDSTP
jgi:hypothetical protein